MEGSTHHFNWNEDSNNNKLVNDILFNYCINNTNSDINLVKQSITNSDCSNYYATMNTDVFNMQVSNNTIRLALLNRDLIASSYIANFNLTKLHLLPAIINEVLISLGKLCNHNIEVHLTKEDIIIIE